MDRLYRFSPITTEAAFQQAVEYVVSELEILSERLVKQKLPITTLKLFAHYPEEYDFLRDLVSGMGPKSKYSSETSLYVDVEEEIKGHQIKYLGVRIVDPYRMQIGCGDYEIENFAEFKKTYLNKSLFIRDFRGEMIELWRPDVDVLGYILQAQ